MAVRNWKAAKSSREIKTQGGPGTAASGFQQNAAFLSTDFPVSKQIHPLQRVVHLS